MHYLLIEDVIKDVKRGLPSGSFLQVYNFDNAYDSLGTPMARLLVVLVTNEGEKFTTHQEAITLPQSHISADQKQISYETASKISQVVRGMF